MPTRVQLEVEPWWGDEFEPPALAAFNARLRVRYGLSKALCGSKGDENHLKGRHRSRAWDLNSIYCTNRDYATRDARDTQAPEDALRATDLGITGATLRAVSKRLDVAVRAGLLPGLAEWFGTIDGINVTGWFEGHASTSGSSHLSHLHMGFWTRFTDDAAFFSRLYAIVTGDDMDWRDLLPDPTGRQAGPGAAGDLLWIGTWHAWDAKTTAARVEAAVTAGFAADATRDAAQLAAIQALATAGGVDAAPIVAAIEAVRDEARAEYGRLHAELAELRAENIDLRTRLAEAARVEADRLAAG